MSLINIGVDNRDATYRYKMPPLQTKIEGRGNGIKTVIVNMTDVAKALHIDPAYPTKYFGIELGAQSKYNEKTERAIVNGAHTASDMQKMIEKFIQIFILCPTCKLPEIKMIVKSSIKIDCAACGYNGELKTPHKLAGYIIKYEEKEKATKKKGKKDGAKDDEESEDDEQAQAKVAPVKKPEEDEKKYEIFDTDTSKEAQRIRQQAEFEELKSKNAANREIETLLDTVKISGGAIDSPVTVLKIYLADPNRTYDQIAAELKRIAISRDLDDAHRVQTLVQALIDPTEPKTVKTQFAKHAKLLAHFTKKEERGATLLLNCIEDLTGVTERKLLKFVSPILMSLYESDVLSEDAITTWYNSPPESSWLVSKEVAQEIRVKAKPFIDWLQTADEEED